MKKEKYTQVLTDLRKSLAWIDLVLANLAEGVLVVGEDYKVYFANDSAAQIIGKERVLLMGLSIWEVLPLIRENQIADKTFFVDALKSQKSENMSGTYFFERDEQRLTFDVKVRFIRKIKQAVFWINDITEQKEHEEAFRQEQIALIREQIARDEAEKERARLYSLFMQAPVPIAIIKGVNQVYELSNEANNKALGRKIMPGQTVKEVLPEAEKMGLTGLIDKVYRTGETFHGNELPLVLDIPGIGVKTQYVNAIYQPLRDLYGNVEAIMAIGIDVTEQVLARQKVEESQKLLQTIIDGSNAVIYLKDVKGKYMMINSAFEKLFNFTREEVKGKTDYDIFPKAVADELRVNDKEVLRTRGTLHREESVGLGKSLRTYISVKFPLFDTNGKPYAVCGISTDITERKERERRKDNFIDMASHELKTPVTSMKIFNKVIKDLAAKGDVQRVALYSSKIGVQLDRLAKLVNELLNLSRIQSGRLEMEKELFDLNVLVKEMVTYIQISTQKHAIHIEGKLDSEVYADRERIAQVVTNLVTNAVKYSPDGGDVFVRIKKEDDYVNVSVQDFGIGIAQKYQSKVFERFFQVSGHKEKTFPGLGIGLFISSVIIQRHGGEMAIQSVKGKGSTFSFTLPLNTH